MYTYQMVAVADENNRTYKSRFGTYDYTYGFNFNDEAIDHCADVGVEGFVWDLFHEDLWKLVDEPKVKKMSLADIEKELGYRIQIIDPEPEEEEISPERKKEVDDAIDFFERLFGACHNINREDYY